MCPRWPKMAQDGPKMAQDGPKMPPNDPKVGLNIVIFQKMENLPCENAVSITLKDLKIKKSPPQDDPKMKPKQIF